MFDEVDYDRGAVWNFSNVPGGTYRIVLEAEDHGDHVVQDAIEVLVGDVDPTDPTADPTGAETSGADSDGGSESSEGGGTGGGAEDGGESDPGGSSSSSADDGGDTDSEGDDPTAGEEAAAQGCACSSGGGAAPLAGMWLPLVSLGRRRRRGRVPLGGTGGCRRRKARGEPSQSILLCAADGLRSPFRLALRLRWGAPRSSGFERGGVLGRLWPGWRGR
jgi:hypothetical protein